MLTLISCVPGSSLSLSLSLCVSLARSLARSLSLSCTLCVCVCVCACVRARALILRLYTVRLCVFFSFFDLTSVHSPSVCLYISVCLFLSIIYSLDELLYVLPESDGLG